MKTIWGFLQLSISAIGGWLGFVLGGFDGFLYALIGFMAVDYCTGVMCAILDKKLSSVIGFRGIFKKLRRSRDAVLSTPSAKVPSATRAP